MHRPLTTQTRYKRTARFLSLSFSHARAFVTTFARCTETLETVRSVRACVRSCVCIYVYIMNRKVVYTLSFLSLFLLLIFIINYIYVYKINDIRVFLKKMMIILVLSPIYTDVTKKKCVDLLYK